MNLRKNSLIDKTKILVIHEFNGEKYFEAIILLASKQKFDVLIFRESSVIKQFIRNWLREKKKISYAIYRAFENLLFRIKVPSLKNETLILAMPPWDFRMLWYSLLARNNKIIYHTSWPNWHIDKVPRRYGLLSYIFRFSWHRFLSSSNVQIVTVISESAEHLRKYFPNTEISVIPHVVSSEFSCVQPSTLDDSLKVLFVGELIEKKGLRLLPHIIEELSELPIHFGIIGDGPLRPLVNSLADNPKVRVYGKITNRKVLADIYSQHHLLIVPSQKTQRWEELFGMVIIEAMSVGLPVIASNHVGPRSILSNQEDGFLVSEDSVDEFINSIRYLYEHRDIWEKMSKNAQIKSNDYSIDVVASQWLNLLSP